ncbi:condensation domain-containing protein, partial [Pseudosporangium ferrugineum]
MPIRFNYAVDLFDEATVRSLLDRFVSVLRQVVDEPGRRIARLDLLTTEERQKLLVSWNDTTTPVGPQSLPQLFEAQAAKRPQATAVVFEDQQLSYAQLNEQAN